MLLKTVRKKEKKKDKENLLSLGVDLQSFRLWGEVKSISPQLYWGWMDVSPLDNLFSNCSG